MRREREPVAPPAQPVVRAQVAPQLWWQVQPQPQIGETFRAAGGRQLSVDNVWPSDGGWLYTTVPA